MSERRPPAIRKSDLAPAFEAANASGFDHVSIEVDTIGGERFIITAVKRSDTSKPNMTKLEKWRAENANN